MRSREEEKKGGMDKQNLRDRKQAFATESKEPETSVLWNDSSCPGEQEDLRSALYQMIL